MLLGMTNLWSQTPSRMILTHEVILKTNEIFSGEIDVKGRRSPKGKVYLKFAGRIDCQYKSGSQPGVDVFVNGIPVSRERLVNKPETYPFGEFDVLWYRGDARWTLPYYDWSISHPPQPHIHLFVFDITSLLKNEKAVIEIVNIFGAFPNSRVILREVEVLFTDEFPIVEGEGSRIPGPLTELRDKASGYHAGAKVKLQSLDKYEPRTIAPRKDFTQHFTVSVNEAGIINLLIGGETYQVDSQFGFPELGWVNARKGGNWQRFEAGKERLLFENAFVTIERTLHISPTHLEVRDHIKNRTDKDLPIGILNSLDIGNPDKLSEFRLSGKVMPTFWANTEPATGMITPMLPLAFVARQNSGMGIWIEDNAYRNHLSFLAHESRLYAADERFYLQPKGEHTFVWRLYPVEDRSYFTVLNTHRHVENVFREIPGLSGFVYPEQTVDASLKDAESVKAFFEKTGITIAGMLPAEEVLRQPKFQQFMTYGNESLDRIKKGNESPARVMKLAKEAGLNSLKFIVYTDIHLLNIRNEKNWMENMGESVIRDAKGRFVPFTAGQNYCVLPKEGTPAARRFEATVNWYLDEGGYDGIFFDEWPNSRAGVSFSPGHEDGVSAIINDKFQIQRKYGVVALLANDFQRRLVQDLKRKHPEAIFYANHFNVTSEANRWPIINFAEPTQHDDDFLRAAQAGVTPLALNTKYTATLWDDVMEFLRQGVLMTYYSKRFGGDHLLKYIYPITVKENGPGYVIGDGKIVTRVSGNYHFHRDIPLKARIFEGPQAALRREEFSTLENGLASINLELKNDEVAVVTEEPAAP